MCARNPPSPADLMPTVLVLDGQSGPALSFTRSLGRAGWRVLAAEGTRSARSRFGEARPLADAVHPESFSASLTALLRRERVDVIVPCTDASVVEVWRHAALLNGAQILGGDRLSASRYVDKARTLAAADEHGFPTPRWVSPRNRDEAIAAMSEHGFPVVLKPTCSYVAEGPNLRHRRHVVIRQENDFDEALSSLAGPGKALPIVQEYVPGRALAVTAVLRRGAVLGLVARETFSFSPVTGGTSVWKRTIAPTEPGVQEAIRLLQALEYEGLAEVEYQVAADGTPRLMEIGVRAHGWIGLAVAAGVDLPLIAASALVGANAPATTSTYRVGVEMRWLAGEIANLKVALSRRPLLPPEVTRLDVLRSAWPPWRPGMHYDGIQLRDMAPWLSPGRRRRTRDDDTKGLDEDAVHSRVSGLHEA